MASSAENPLEKAIINAAEVVESQIDERIQKLDNMDDEELERLRERRIRQMKERQEKKTEYLAAGHGAYIEVTDQRDFFDMIKKSKRVVCHFYRPTTWRCEVVDKHLGRMAVKHIETKFIKVNVEKSPFLVERLNIVVIPSIVLVIDNKTNHTIQGFDELGGDGFTFERFETVLLRYKVIESVEDSVV